jgi:hypothetical protein
MADLAAEQVVYQALVQEIHHQYLLLKVMMEDQLDQKVKAVAVVQLQ